MSLFINAEIKVIRLPQWNIQKCLPTKWWLLTRLLHTWKAVLCYSCLL